MFRVLFEIKFTFTENANHYVRESSRVFATLNRTIETGQEAFSNNGELLLSYIVELSLQI